LPDDPAILPFSALQIRLPGPLSLVFQYSYGHPVHNNELIGFQL
jgi:hypothetical protein